MVRHSRARPTRLDSRYNYVSTNADLVKGLAFFMGKYKKFLETRKEIIFVDTTIRVNWASINKSHYESLGYEYTGMGNEFVCKISDLSNGSDIYVRTKCPVCSKIKNEAYNKVLLKGHTLCGGCRQINDLTGIKFNRLTAIKIDKNYKKKHLKWICECECGEIKSVQSRHLISSVTQSCGCYHKEIAMMLSGENSPYWNHDLSEKERTNRRAYGAYARWRLSVFERDEFACCVCGNDRGGDLRAHHLNSYKKHKSQQLDQNNGITLCVSCHDEFHRGFMGDTKIPCTLNDFIKWLITKEKKPTEVMGFLENSEIFN